MLHRTLLVILLVCVSVKAYQLENEELIEDLLQDDDAGNEESFDEIFSDYEMENENLPTENEDDENELTTYENESPVLMDDDSDATEKADRDSVEVAQKDPLWGRRFRVRIRRFRLPRVRLRRIRLRRVRLPRIRLRRIRLPRIRVPRIRFRSFRIRLRRLINPKSLLKKLISKFYKKKEKNPCPYSETAVETRIYAMRCPAHWKTFFTNTGTASEIVDGEHFTSYCQTYTLCKACAPSSPWSGAQCESKLNNQIQMFCNEVSTQDDGTMNVGLLSWCQDKAKKIQAYERTQSHSHNADLCVCGVGEVGKP